MDRHLRHEDLGNERRRAGETARRPAEGDGGDLVDARERDDDQRHQEQDAQSEREGGARHEVVALPERDDGREPRADEIGRGRKHERLRGRGAIDGQDRQAEEQAEKDGETRSLEVVRIGNGAGPGELGLARGVEQAPIRADAALERLPGLVDRLDDVVVDAIGLGARDEVADDHRLLDAAGVGVMEIVAGARPTELGDDDALAGVGAAQLVVELDGLVDRPRDIEALPVGQDVRGNEVDGRGELRMVDPDCPDFTRSNRHWARPLHALDELHEVGHAHLRPQCRLVTDDDRVDVVVTAREVESGADFPLVALLVLVDPRADRDLEAEFRGDRRDQFGAAGRRIGADGTGVGRNRPQVSADLLDGGAITIVGMLRGYERRV